MSEVGSADIQWSQDVSAQANLAALNAVFFDGHVESLNDRRSRDIDRWYPTGAPVNDAHNMTTEPVGSVVP